MYRRYLIFLFSTRILLLSLQQYLPQSNVIDLAYDLIFMFLFTTVTHVSVRFLLSSILFLNGMCPCVLILIRINDFSFHRRAVSAAPETERRCAYLIFALWASFHSSNIDPQNDI